MPQGRIEPGDVMGLSRGWLTADELHDHIKRNATAAIEHWERVTATESSSADERRAAMWAVVRALLPMGRKSFVLNGKRYKVISNAKTTEIRVTPAPKKNR
jgi:hypothetical protein